MFTNRTTTISNEFANKQNERVGEAGGRRREKRERVKKESQLHGHIRSILPPPLYLPAGRRGIRFDKGKPALPETS